MGEKGQTFLKENNTKVYVWILTPPGVELDSPIFLSVSLVTRFQKTEYGKGKISSLTAEKPGRHTVTK